MDWVRTKAVFRKEALHIRRDPRSLIQLVAMPVLLLLLYGYAITFDIRNAPLAVYDMERTQQSRDLAARFDASCYFDLKFNPGSYAELRRLFDEGRVGIAVVIPDDFTRRLDAGGQATLQAIADGSDGNTANILLGYVQGVISGYNQEVVASRLNQRGIRGQPAALQTELRVWYNEQQESRNYIVPGLIVVIMTLVGAMLSSLSVVRERERGSLELLLASPLKRGEITLGKLGPYFIIGMVDLAIAMLMGQFLFHVPLRGSPALLLLMSALFLTAMLSLGMFISVSSRNQLQANQLALFTTFLPAFLLSGFIFAISNMPLPLQGVSYAMPATYFVWISKGIYLKGVGLRYLWLPALMLIAWTVFLLWASQRRFPRTLE